MSSHEINVKPYSHPYNPSHTVWKLHVFYIVQNRLLSSGTWPSSNISFQTKAESTERIISSTLFAHMNIHILSSSLSKYRSLL